MAMAMPDNQVGICEDECEWGIRDREKEQEMETQIKTLQDLLDYSERQNKKAEKKIYSMQEQLKTLQDRLEEWDRIERSMEEINLTQAVQETAGGQQQQPSINPIPVQAAPSNNLEDTSASPDLSSNRKVYSSIASGVRDYSEQQVHDIHISEDRRDNTHGNEDQNSMEEIFQEGKAQEKVKGLIQRNFTTLIKEIDGSDLAQWLIQHGVLNREELAGSEKTSRRILVNLFRRKGNNWVHIFMTFLESKYSPLYELVLGTDQKLSKLQRHVLLAKLYQSGISANLTAQILRELIQRNIARLSRSYVPPDKDQNMKENQAALIDLLGRSDDDWVFPFVKFCRKNLQKMAFGDIFGISF